MKVVLLGVGNSLHSDDGAGPRLAEMFLDSHDVTSFNCGTAPENFTGLVRKLNPDLLLIADAADMGLPAGSVRIIPPEKIRDTAIGTHMLPLYHLVDFLAESSREISIIGIQPASLSWGDRLSDPVASSLIETKMLIDENNLRNIPVL
ncbi:hydrogenase maturation protease [Methanocorpusculum labreanum Z]|uniref:Hydrogenase maturation protease n=1 Tax=Methanocorpusculum labreanum (strain ATCC 43576 / DSM 4855 / Z) TaxID=410358 RepID=A2SSJ9_METLZ|nr:hydrogenase 3 maturation endopeptidase HyCI [Methanocorpusculum labreanum]ABN07305.1 hydrogenase maturation protease [Methanocorpusculum labreanum Z]